MERKYLDIIEDKQIIGSKILGW